MSPRISLRASPCHWRDPERLEELRGELARRRGVVDEGALFPHATHLLRLIWTSPPCMPIHEHGSRLVPIPDDGTKEWADLYERAARGPLHEQRRTRWRQRDQRGTLRRERSGCRWSACDRGNEASSVYAPDRLDVDQWVRVAAEVGMRYAVLTTKHVAGHCLWPSAHTDYHVGSSGNRTDVVGEFVSACAKRGIVPGLYYCSWDNHHRLGSVTWSDAAYEKTHTTRAYRDFQLAQIEELLTRCGPVGEVWVDIPGVLGHDGRREQYAQIVRLAPDALIMMNHGCTDGSGPLRYDYAWPADLMAIERFLPPEPAPR